VIGVVGDVCEAARIIADHDGFFDVAAAVAAVAALAIAIAIAIANRDAVAVAALAIAVADRDAVCGDTLLAVTVRAVADL
jgi:hypothetical protein